MAWKPDFTWKDAAGKEHKLRDMTQESLDALLAALDLIDPATAYASLERLRELAGGKFEKLVVAVKLPERPEYKWLEGRINEVVPDPRWARKLDEVDSKGLRFMRGFSEDAD